METELPLTTTQQQTTTSSASGHAPYFEMMSDKSPTAAVTCPDPPATVVSTCPDPPAKDQSILSEVLKNSDHMDTAEDNSPVSPEETMNGVESEIEDKENESEEEDEMDTQAEKSDESFTSSEPDTQDTVEKDSSTEVSSTKASSAYSIADILNAPANQDVGEEKESVKKVDDKVVPPPTEQQLKSNLPALHPLKHTLKPIDITQSPKPTAAQTGKEIGEVQSNESSILRKNLTDFAAKSNGLDKPKGLCSPSSDEYNLWLRGLGKKPKSIDVPEAKKQKKDEPLSPSVATSYLQGQAAAANWYQNLVTAAPSIFPYSGASFPAVSQLQQIQTMGMYPGYFLPTTQPLQTHSTNTSQQRDDEQKRSDDAKMQKDHDKLFQCRKCPRNFLSPEKLLRHEITHTSPSPFNCGLGLRRKREEEVAKPVVISPTAVENYSTCLLCAERYPNQQLLQAHVALVHRKQSVTAITAPVVSSTVGTKDETQYFRCSFCSYLLPSRMELIEHEKVHLLHSTKLPTESNTTFKCQLCTDVFTDANALKEHERSKHRPIHIPSQSEFPEPEMRATMLQECLQNEQDHSMTNNNHMDDDSEHACPICKKTFESNKLLKSHVKYSHLEERPYTCSICSKSFKQKATLKQHEKLHSDEKPYVCNVCSRGFVYPSRLKTHSQTCKGEPLMTP